MAIPFFIIAFILFVAAYRNQLGYLATNASQDIVGASKWIAAMVAIGVIGLIPKARPISNALYFLVILVLFVANKGIFANIKSGQAFKPVSPPQAPPVPGTTTAAAPAAPPGEKTTGSLNTPDANAGLPTSSGAAPAGGIMSNVIPFPTFGFGPFNLGNVNPFGGATQNKAPDGSGVTIESIDIKPGA